MPKDADRPRDAAPETGQGGPFGAPAAGLLTLPDQIAQKLSEAIALGTYQPGARIPEVEVSRTLQVSRAPVREALRILEKDGVVTMQPNRGARVTSLSAGEVEDLFEIRRLLFGWVAERLCREASAAQLAAIEQRIELLEKLAPQARREKDYMQAVYQLPALIAAMAGNRRLAQILEPINRQTFRYTQTKLRTPDGRRQSAIHWRSWFEATRARDGRKARAAIVALMEETLRIALASIADAEKSAVKSPRPRKAAAG
jgi:DNA-binding GntR family transcriptional regulator